MAKAMLPYVFKKRTELIAVIDYMEGQSTGQVFVQIMNHQVQIGERTGKIRSEGPRFTSPEGSKASRSLGESIRRNKRLTPVDSRTIDSIFHDRKAGLLCRELVRKYGYSRWVLRRIIRDGKPRS
jgi:hypothetical protein